MTSAPAGALMKHRSCYPRTRAQTQQAQLSFLYHYTAAQALSALLLCVRP